MKATSLFSDPFGVQVMDLPVQNDVNNSRVSANDFNMPMFSMPQPNCATIAPSQAIPVSTSSPTMPLVMFSSQQQPQLQQQIPQTFPMNHLMAPPPKSDVQNIIIDKETATTHALHLKFPFKLHFILCEAERCGFGHIISWIPTGDGFRVHDPKAFAATVMPKYFGSSHIKSFQRQLSLYGFRRATEGLNRDAYQHSCFLKANRQLCAYIPREKKRPPKSGGKQHAARDVVSKPCVSPAASETASRASSPSSTSTITNPAPSSWVKEHDHWLSQYVHFLVHGGNDESNNSSSNAMGGMGTGGANPSNDPAAVGSFVPNVKEELEKVTLEEICEEIVTTFRHCNDRHDKEERLEMV